MTDSGAMAQERMEHKPSARERLIVALDVPGKDEALRLVHELDGLVTFYKVGLELLMRGGIEDLIRELARDKQVFLDLKLPGDIDETVRRAVQLAADMGVTFLTLSATSDPLTIRAARAGRGDATQPKLLFVSYLSSRDEADYRAAHPRSEVSFEAFVTERTQMALESGCDGLIASGDVIRTLRGAFPRALIVSPGIRPAGTGADDHKRSSTPSAAISMGADYLVVGRPIRNAAERRRVAEGIIREIEAALAGND
jgi:orotidine-5'-phosphate decarboxylase